VAQDCTELVEVQYLLKSGASLGFLFSKIMPGSRTAIRLT